MFYRLQLLSINTRAKWTDASCIWGRELWLDKNWGGIRVVSGYGALGFCLISLLWTDNYTSGLWILLVNHVFFSLAFLHKAWGRAFPLPQMYYSHTVTAKTEHLNQGFLIILKSWLSRDFNTGLTQAPHSAPCLRVNIQATSFMCINWWCSTTPIKEAMVIKKE